MMESFIYILCCLEEDAKLFVVAPITIYLGDCAGPRDTCTSVFFQPISKVNVADHQSQSVL